MTFRTEDDRQARRDELVSHLFPLLAALNAQIADGERERAAAAPTCRWCFNHSQNLTGCSHCDADGEQIDNIPTEE